MASKLNSDIEKGNCNCKNEKSDLKSAVTEAGTLFCQNVADKALQASVMSTWI